MKIAIITDSNSGISAEEAAALGIGVVPMPFIIDSTVMFENVDITQEQFFDRLGKSFDVSTSQPSEESVTRLWREALSENDEIVYIPMSSGLSASCENACLYSQREEFSGRVFVADNRRISVTQRQSVLDAVTLREKGLSAAEIKAALEKVASESSIYIMVDTLWYIKKGGRISVAAAAIGTILKVKPVLQIQGGKLEAYKKEKGVKHARAEMISAMENDLEKRFGGKASEKEPKIELAVAYTGKSDEAMSFSEQIKKKFPHYEVYVSPLPLSVACHIGDGALAIACSKKLQYCGGLYELFGTEKPDIPKKEKAKADKLLEKADKFRKRAEDILEAYGEEQKGEK